MYENSNWDDLQMSSQGKIEITPTWEVEAQLPRKDLPFINQSSPLS